MAKSGKPMLVFFIGLLHFSGAFEVRVNTSLIPELETFGERVELDLSTWFDYIEYLLTSPGYTPKPSVDVFFDPNFGFKPSSVFATRGPNPPFIYANPDFFKETPDPGFIIWAASFSILDPANSCPSWLWTGIPAWVQYYHYYQVPPKTPEAGQSYKDGHGLAAYFLNYIEKNKFKAIIYNLVRDCRIEGKYDEDTFTMMTGGSFDDLWNLMLNDTTINNQGRFYGK